jgi:hypothetical protein
MVLLLIAILGKCGSNNTPRHPNTPFEKQAGGQHSRKPRNKILAFFAPRPRNFSFTKLENLIFNQRAATMSANSSPAKSLAFFAPHTRNGIRISGANRKIQIITNLKI